MKDYRYFFFDMDGTLTESRSFISESVASELRELQKNGRVVIVISGAEDAQIRYQLREFKPDFIMSQSGAYCSLWKKKLVEREKVEIQRHISKIKERFPDWLGSNSSDLVQDRGCQIAFSLIGHNADKYTKKVFDPNGDKRRLILQSIPFFSNSIEVRIGGTTCLDYTHKEYNKGKNVSRFIRMNEWDKNSAVYFGDALFVGGNDESVLGVIETFSVTSPKDLIDKLKFYV